MSSAGFSLEELIKRANSFGILDMQQVSEIWRILGTRDVTVDEFLQATIRHGYLTKYQMERLKFGENSGFFFGDYNVLYLVGAGTFARVYRAVNKKNKKMVALKVLRSRYTHDKIVLDHFIREAELCMQLHHPNIVNVHEMISDDTGHYMVMDFIEGQTLREYLQNHKIVTPKIATRIIIDVCQAIDYAAKRGHSHRDMKLSNIILSSSGKAILVDFGLSATEEDVASKVRNQRAIDYAALEKLTGAPRNDMRSDIYFLGTIFYHLLTGSAPLLETTDRARRMERTRFTNVRPVREKNQAIPMILGLIVDKAMSFDPERRFQSAGEFLRELEFAVSKIDTEGKEETGIMGNKSSDTGKTTAKTALQPLTKAILVVEGKPDMQDIFRNSFKEAGYRVLVMSDTERAIEHFEIGEKKIDLVLINAQSLGGKAVVAFNKLATMARTEDIPAILLLDEKQTQWAGKTIRKKHRLVVGMPISMKRLMNVVKKLLETPDEFGDIQVKSQSNMSTKQGDDFSDIDIQDDDIVQHVTHKTNKMPVENRESVVPTTSTFTRSDTSSSPASKPTSTPLAEPVQKSTSEMPKIMMQDEDESVLFNIAFDTVLKEATGKKEETKIEIQDSGK